MTDRIWGQGGRLQGLLLAVCQALENSTSALSGSLINLLRVFILTPQTPRSQSFSSPVSDPPVAAAVVSHFNDCPDSHSQFCFHGTCRFLVQEDKPACVCHSGYVGARCEHADLLAVVAASQKKQAITALVVVSIVALAVLIIACVLIHCCQVRKHCEWCQALICRHEKPSALLKGRTACCHSETGKGLPRGGAFFPRETQLEEPQEGPGQEDVRAKLDS
ncbi:protransforming growth factor alpha [Lynx rufus]|uniref:protransforming growth factor alpha n=1 Tax=Lynx rufus TaxID=61384 RepID=UPI001F126C64|nr:protransforming growth factor alpha [Lynx rufus]